MLRYLAINLIIGSVFSFVIAFISSIVKCLVDSMVTKTTQLSLISIYILDSGVVTNNVIVFKRPGNFLILLITDLSINGIFFLSLVLSVV